MTRRSFFSKLAFALPAFAQPRRPNPIIILADDMGYGDIGCYGSLDVPTPNMDGLARTGTRFTDGYVSCAVCSPSRAALLIGRYQHRFGHEFNSGPIEREAVINFGLTASEKVDFIVRAGRVPSTPSTSARMSARFARPRQRCRRVTSSSTGFRT